MREVNYVYRCHMLGVFAEYDQLNNRTRLIKYTKNEAMIPENALKHRLAYSSLKCELSNPRLHCLPFDHSRVKLAVLPGNDDSTDYINASYIPGYWSKREYVATQTPVESTLPDFWRMIWELRSQVIVALKQPRDVLMPLDMHHAGISATVTSCSEFSGFELRKFLISKDSGEKCEVCHFYCPKLAEWDHYDDDVPNDDDIIELLKMVRQHAGPGVSSGHPIVVQCVYGMDHSECFIALDYLYQCIDNWDVTEDRSVDVFGYVLAIRHCRPFRMQSHRYLYVYQFMDTVIRQKLKEKGDNLGNKECASLQDLSCLAMTSRLTLEGIDQLQGPQPLLRQIESFALKHNSYRFKPYQPEADVLDGDMTLIDTETSSTHLIPPKCQGKRYRPNTNTRCFVL